MGRSKWMAVLLLAAGCATHRASAPKPVFYPPPPEEPRLQYLMSFSTADDVAPQSAFARFIAGRAPRRPIVKPYGISVARDRIFVCDTATKAIEILDLRKPKMEYFTPDGEGQFRVPLNIAVDADGTRYVADAGRGQVLIYTDAGEYVGGIGKRAVSAIGTNPAVMEMKPTDVLVTSNRLYVTDTKGHAVRVYDKESRKLQFAFPRGATNDASRLFQPMNLAIDTQGRIYVSDTGAFRVKQYDANGRYLRAFGGVGDRPGQFALPKGVAVDREGRVYVVDAKSQVIQIFDPEGKLLLFFGEPQRSAASLYLPATVAIDYENVDWFRKYAAPEFHLEYLVMVSNQYGKRKISVYGFGHRQ
jgi:sugar lactone lactonase YvrE